MGRKSALAEMETAAKKLAHAVYEAVASSYGVVGFASGPLYKGKIGSRAVNLHNGGLCLRVFPDRSVEIVVRVLLGYKVRALSTAVGIRQTTKYVLQCKDYSLKDLSVYIEGVRSMD